MSSTMIGVVLATKALTDDELAALNNVAQVDWDPRNYPFYEKVRGLFTEADGTQMHLETKNALAAVVLQRLA